jgi:hypothetical protein
MELKIADQDMYGYRHTGPHEPPTRVRVIAGQQIPPDLVDLEATKDFAEQRQYPDVVAAHQSEEQQAELAKANEAAIAQPSQYNPDQPENDMPVSRSSATAAHSAEDRAQASAKADKRSRQAPKRSGKDEAAGE